MSDLKEAQRCQIVQDKPKRGLLDRKTMVCCAAVMIYELWSGLSWLSPFVLVVAGFLSRFYPRPSITGDVESIVFQFICFLLADESLWTAAAIIINCPVEEEGLWGLITCEAKWTTVIQAETTTTNHDGVLNRIGYLIFLLVGCIGTREQWKAINLIRISQNTGNKSWTCLWAKEKECCRWKFCRTSV